MLVGSTKIQWSYEGNCTTCNIKQGDDIVMRQSVKRFVGDTPNKRLARKRAFEKAMKLVAQYDLLPKPQRSQIWNQFRTNINQPILNT